MKYQENFIIIHGIISIIFLSILFVRWSTNTFINILVKIALASYSIMTSIKVASLIKGEIIGNITLTDEFYIKGSAIIFIIISVAWSQKGKTNIIIKTFSFLVAISSFIQTLIN